MCAGYVVNVNHRGTLEESSTLGAICYPAARPAAASEDSMRSKNEVSITSKLACSAACSASALLTFHAAPSDPLSEKPVYGVNVVIGNCKDTLEASSTLGPECSVAAYPAPALEEFDQRRNEASTTSKLVCTATCSLPALDIFDNAHVTLHTTSSTCSKDYLLDICDNLASSDPLPEEPVHDENVAIHDRKDTLEALSTLGPQCSDAACPAPALEDFDQSHKAASTTLRPACSAACSASALDTFDNEHLTLHTMSSTCFKDYLADSCDNLSHGTHVCLDGGTDHCSVEPVCVQEKVACLLKDDQMQALLVFTMYCFQHDTTRLCQELSHNAALLTSLSIAYLFSFFASSIAGMPATGTAESSARKTTTSPAELYYLRHSRSCAACASAKRGGGAGSAVSLGGFSIAGMLATRTQECSAVNLSTFSIAGMAASCTPEC